VSVPDEADTSTVWSVKSFDADGVPASPPVVKDDFTRE
jgi:hypothetical protein